MRYGEPFGSRGEESFLTSSWSNVAHRCRRGCKAHKFTTSFLHFVRVASVSSSNKRGHESGWLPHPVQVALDFRRVSNALSGLGLSVAPFRRQEERVSMDLKTKRGRSTTTFPTIFCKPHSSPACLRPLWSSLSCAVRLHLTTLFCAFPDGSPSLALCCCNPFAGCFAHFALRPSCDGLWVAPIRIHADEDSAGLLQAADFSFDSRENPVRAHTG
jgi:hypothetical protein